MHSVPELTRYAIREGLASAQRPNVPRHAGTPPLFSRVEYREFGRTLPDFCGQNTGFPGSDYRVSGIGLRPGLIQIG